MTREREKVYNKIVKLLVEATNNSDSSCIDKAYEICEEFNSRHYGKDEIFIDDSDDNFIQVDDERLYVPDEIR